MNVTELDDQGVEVGVCRQLAGSFNKVLHALRGGTGYSITLTYDCLHQNCTFIGMALFEAAAKVVSSLGVNDLSYNYYITYLFFTTNESYEK